MQIMNNSSYKPRLTFYASRETGFTIIELLIVISLVGIVSAIATPQFMQLIPGMRVNTATRQVMSKMLLLKMKAVSENKSYQLTFTPGGGQYQIKLSGTVVEATTLPAGIIFGTNATKKPGGGSITCTDDSICFAGNVATFTANGTATSGTIYLIPQLDKTSGGTSRMRAISINSTGRIKAYRYSGISPDYWKNF